MTPLSDLSARIATVPLSHRFGHVQAVRSGSLDIAGLAPRARVGDQVRLSDDGGEPLLEGEVVALDGPTTRVMPYGALDGIGIGGLARLDPLPQLAPCATWIGRVVDAFGGPLDGRPLPAAADPVARAKGPPPAAHRGRLGRRLHTGIAAIDTMLPLARGQRIGIFAGSGIGKSTLLAEIARNATADRVVLGLIGERGRELRGFLDDVLGPAGLARSVVVTATADQSPLIKRRAAFTAMTVAERFRDQGQHVLLILDSVTRLAEAHREVALTAGEPASLRAFPPSTAGLISAFAERAGPGPEGSGDITAVFSVLVAGSDMEEPVADMCRGVLDGHIVLDREIAERGRFPAIDVRRSVSRSLPEAATDEENVRIRAARRVLGTYEAAAPMIQAGLYQPGSDADIDAAMRIWPALDRFFGRTGVTDTAAAFAELADCLAKGDEPGSARPR